MNIVPSGQLLHPWVLSQLTANVNQTSQIPCYVRSRPTPSSNYTTGSTSTLLSHQNVLNNDIGQMLKTLAAARLLSDAVQSIAGRPTIAPVSSSLAQFSLRSPLGSNISQAAFSKTPSPASLVSSKDSKHDVSNCAGLRLFNRGEDYHLSTTRDMSHANRGVKRQFDVASVSPQGAENDRKRRTKDARKSTTGAEMFYSKRMPQQGQASSSQVGHHQKPAAFSGRIPSRVDSTEWSDVSDAIWSYYVRHRQTQEVYFAKMKLRDAIFHVLKSIYPYCGLYVVGSSNNGLSTDCSDMDMCLMLSPEEIDQKFEARNILKTIMRSLKKCNFISKPLLIQAKVPIIKFKDKVSSVEVDINVNNSVGIRNTHLLNMYSKMDERVCPLVVIVKCWAKEHNINDANQRTISSYSLQLMVVHYLQCGCSPPVLPCLHKLLPGKFSNSTDVRTLALNENPPRWRSNNIQSLGRLFVGFLNYYANVFKYDKDCISVRAGVRLPRHVVIKQRSCKDNPPTQWKYLCIEEPFDLSNTARSVYDEEIFREIVKVFKLSWRCLENTKDINSIISKLD